MAAGDDEEFSIGKLFVAGAVTAAGATAFWGIWQLITKPKPRPEYTSSRVDEELEAIMISVAATDVADGS